MTVRAKMRCVKAKRDETSENCYVELQPVYDDGGENASWSKWTPCGQVSLTISNPAAYNQFEIGKSYMVDFTPVD